MSIPKLPYPAEFRRQMVELVYAGRTPPQLAAEFDCSAQSMSNWVAQATADSGKPTRNKVTLPQTCLSDFDTGTCERPAAEGAYRQAGKCSPADVLKRRLGRPGTSTRTQNRVRAR